jgi:hypothetical protein
MSGLFHPSISPAERAGIDAQREAHLMRLRDADVWLSVELGLWPLKRASDEAGRQLAPTFDAERVSFADGDCFSLVGRSGGSVVCTAAAVVRDIPAGLANAMQDLSLFYDRETIVRRPPDAWCEVHCDGLNEIRGRMAFLGAMWADPKAASLLGEGGGFIRHVGPVVALTAYELWKPDHLGSLQLAKDAETIAFDLCGYRDIRHGIRYADAGYPVAKNGLARIVISLMSRARVRSDILKLPVIA